MMLILDIVIFLVFMMFIMMPSEFVEMARAIGARATSRE
jgi:hypothetical protein